MRQTATDERTLASLNASNLVARHNKPLTALHLKRAFCMCRWH